MQIFQDSEEWGMVLNAYKIVDDNEYYRSITENNMIIGVSNDDIVKKL